MQGVVYVDILVLVNAIIGYFVLKCTAFLAGREQRPWRMCAASLLAGLSALTLLWTNLAWPLALVVKGVCAGGIIAAAFRADSLRTYLKCLVWYMLLNVLLGGAVALAVLCGARNLSYKNFSLYLHISPVVLIACILIMYALIQGGTYVFGKPAAKQRVEVSFFLDEKQAQGMALLDTGMHLKDGITGENAALCSFETLKRQLSPAMEESLQSYFVHGTLSPPFWLMMVKTATGMRALPAVRAEALTVNHKSIRKTVLVFTSEILLDGTCDMMLPPDLIQGR